MITTVSSKKSSMHMNMQLVYLQVHKHGLLTSVYVKCKYIISNPRMTKRKQITESGLISESFSLWLKSPKIGDKS